MRREAIEPPRGETAPVLALFYLDVLPPSAQGCHFLCRGLCLVRSTFDPPDTLLCLSAAFHTCLMSGLPNHPPLPDAQAVLWDRRTGARP